MEPQTKVVDGRLKAENHKTKIRNEILIQRTEMLAGDPASLRVAVDE